MTDEERDALLSVMASDLGRVVKAIEGNGRPGLNDRMTAVETRLNERDRTAMKVGIGSAGITAVVTAILAHFGIRLDI